MRTCADRLPTLFKYLYTPLVAAGLAYSGWAYSQHSFFDHGDVKRLSYGPSATSDMVPGGFSDELSRTRAEESREYDLYLCSVQTNPEFPTESWCESLKGQADTASSVSTVSSSSL